MSALSSGSTRARDRREIPAADLQLLLRRVYGERLRVLSSSTEALLPPGENFACSLFRVSATIGRVDGEGQEEVVHAVAKRYPQAPELLCALDFSMYFEKEIFFYERLAPAYADLERRYAGGPEGVQLDIVPSLVGFRKSLEMGKEAVDDGVVVLMENLKIQGYYTLDKIKGMDLEHSRLAIKSLARFHALGVACKHYQPDFWEGEVLPRAKVVPYKEKNEQVDLFDVMFAFITRDERVAALGEHIRPLLAPEMKGGYFGYVAPEPWLSVVHLDFWTNNIMYKADDAGRPVAVKFVDFQNYACNSPLRDLPYFLCSSTSAEVMDHHLDELLDLYYGTFVGILEKLQCDTRPFSRESFDEQLKIDAGFEFFHNILAIKFFCAKIDKSTYDPSQFEKVIILSEPNQMEYDKWYNILLTYIKKGWI